jgi:hypothetical protein
MKLGTASPSIVEEVSVVDMELFVVERGSQAKYLAVIDQGRQYHDSGCLDYFLSSSSSDFAKLSFRVLSVFNKYRNLIGSLGTCSEISDLTPESLEFLSRKRTKDLVVEAGRVSKPTKVTWPSNVPLAVIAGDLIELGFATEIEEKLALDLPFVDELSEVLNKRIVARPRVNVDAYHREMKVLLQVEAGQAWANKNYLRNFFEGIALPGHANYIGIALCAKCTQTSDDFRNVAPRLYALYRSLDPVSLKGFFVISY